MLIDTGQSRRALERLTPSTTTVAVVFVLVFTLGARLEIDTDVWWHLRAGAEIMRSGVIRTDNFSFTKGGAAWIDHSWGSQVVMQLLWSRLGYGGLELLAGALALCGGVFVYLMSSGGSYLRSAGVALASITASVFWMPRPQMFSYALTAAVLYVLWLRRRRGVDALWTLPVLMLAWANLHGGFAIGLLVILLTVFGEAAEQLVPLDDRGRLPRPAVRKLAIVALVSLAAVCVNPYGPRLLAVPFATASGSFTGGIEEWRPPDLHQPGFWPFAVMLVLLVGALAASTRRSGWTDGLVCIAFTLLALDAGRNVSTFAVAVTPVLTYHLAGVLSDRNLVVRRIARASSRVALVDAAVIACVVVLAGVVVGQSFSARRVAAAERSALPVGAVAFLREHPVRGRLFNDYAFGGYLIHELPGVPVFVDGRSDLYGGRFLGDYGHIAAAEDGWDAALRRWGIATAVVERRSEIDDALRSSAGWRLRYADAVAAVYERRPR